MLSVHTTDSCCYAVGDQGSLNKCQHKHCCDPPYTWDVCNYVCVFVCKV